MNFVRFSPSFRGRGLRDMQKKIVMSRYSHIKTSLAMSTPALGLLGGASVAYSRGARCDAPPWPDHKNFLQATISKGAFFAIFQQELQNSTMFDGLLSYR